MNSPVAKSILVALLAVILAFTWQALTVHYNYGGNWTALFCTGEKVPVPPQLAGEGIYLFRGRIGYDGQFYHYMAHDPFLQKGFAQYQDAARLRYRRILVPAAAYLLAGGKDRFVDTALFGVIWISIFLGAYWLSRYASFCSWRPAWGLAFLLVPATIVAIDRTVVDVTLTALALGFAWHSREGPSWKVYLVLVCAALTRETGILLPAAYSAYLLWNRRMRLAAVFATSVLPALAWQHFSVPQTTGDIPIGVGENPLHIFLHFSLLRHGRYDLPAGLALSMTVLDYVLAAGVLLSVLLAVWFFFRKPRLPEAFGSLSFAALMVLTMLMVTLQDPFTYSRLASPLLVLLAARAMRESRWAGCVPLLLVTLRTAAQLAPQALGILRGLAGV